MHADYSNHVPVQLLPVARIGVDDVRTFLVDRQLHAWLAIVLWMSPQADGRSFNLRFTSQSSGNPGIHPSPNCVQSAVGLAYCIRLAVASGYPV